MSLAKGKIFITKEQLGQLFGLPEGVEIIAVKVKEAEEGYEFLVMSAEETPITRKNVPMNLMRRIALQVEKVEIQQTQPQQQQPQVHKGMAEISFGENGISINNFSGNEVEVIKHSQKIEVIKQNQKDVKELFNEILEGVKGKSK